MAIFRVVLIIFTLVTQMSGSHCAALSWNKARCSKATWFCFFVLSFFTCINEAFSAECSSLTAAATHDWYPVAFTAADEPDKAAGVAIEIVKQIARSLKIPVEIDNTLPWSRAIKYMDEGKLDMLIGHYSSKKRLEYWHISKPLFEDDIRVFFHRDNREKIHSSEDLYHLDGVYPRGASFGDALDFTIKRKMRAYAFKDGLAMMKVLLKKRYDFGISAKLDIDSLIVKFSLQDQILVSAFSLAKNSVHFAFSKKSPCAHVFAKFNALVEQYTSEQQLKAFMQNAMNVYFADMEPIKK